MSELTDLEICKRIAEIEGIDFQIQNKKILPKDPANAIKDKLTDVYNPLTDKALCFDLMVKHDIWLSSVRSNKFLATYSLCRGIECQNPQRAICLAIIEVNKEQ